MGSTTNINWADATVNFWEGCTKVSEGCKFCYMYRDLARWKKDGAIVRKVSDKTIKKTLRDLKEPSRIFTCSYSDFFIEEADDWRPEAWRIIRENSQHQWMILTKRPERILECLPEDWGDGYPNVWLGISAENQERYDERLIHLLKVPCKIRFISAEPLLSGLDLRLYMEISINLIPVHLRGRVIDFPAVMDMIHWVIVGGESGNDTGKWRYRPCYIDWINDIVAQGVLFDTPIWVKQLGTYIAKKEGLPPPGHNTGEYPLELPEY